MNETNIHTTIYTTLTTTTNNNNNNNNDIHTDHQILARRPDLIMINRKKRICKIIDFAVPADH